MAIGLAVSVLKPWDAGVGAAPESSDAPRSAPTAFEVGVASSPAPTRDPVRRFCLAPSGWRITSLEHFDQRTVRTWQTIDPIAATGPTDPAIPIGRLVSTRVMTIGWCSPTDGTESDDEPVRVRAWVVTDPNAARPLPLRIGRGESGLGGDYRPPARRVQQLEAWPPGRYVLAVDGPTPDTRWFAIDVVRYQP